MAHKKWTPEVIAGGAAPDRNPVTARFGRRLDQFVAEYAKRHPELGADEALIVIMQFAAGFAVTRGIPLSDYTRGSGELYSMEDAARRGGA